MLSVVGVVDVPRRYFACDNCDQSAAPLDAWAGIGRRTISDEVRRLVVLAGSTWSFDQASAKLKELCRLSVSNDTVRAVCDEEGKRLPVKNVQWAVDVYHVSEHVHDCGRALFGEGSEAGRAWSEQRLQDVLEQGGLRFVEQLKTLAAAAG